MTLTKANKMLTIISLRNPGELLTAKETSYLLGISTFKLILTRLTGKYISYEWTYNDALMYHIGFPFRWPAIGIESFIKRRIEKGYYD